MPIETVPGTELTYHLIPFDAAGRERDEAGDAMRYQALQALRDEPVTDVFLMSLGWIGDVSAARRRYNAWIGAMAACPADFDRMRRARPGFHPLVVGLHWPSLPWGAEDLDAGAPAPGPPGADPVEEVVERCAAAIADTEDARKALRTIVAAAHAAAGPPTLPPAVAAAYGALDREAGLGAGGAAAAPGHDREPFEPERVFQRAQEEAVRLGGLPSGGLLAPLRALSFGRMKDLARQFGEGTAHRFLGDLRYAADARDVRFHLMGHGFGGIVAAAMLAGPRTAALDLTVHSLALVQGALSLWSFASDLPVAPGPAGYFRRILEERRVWGPILTTRSDSDRAAGRWYPWAAGAVANEPGAFPPYGALGSFGARGPGVEAIDLPMARIEHAYGFHPGQVYNLDGSPYIHQGGGFAGAHTDIAHPEVAHAIWEAARPEPTPE